MKLLKLVGAKTYYCEAITGGYVLEGGVAEVSDDKVAATLLAESRIDDRNNRHKIFVPYTEAMAAADEQDDDEDEGGHGDEQDTEGFVQPIPPTTKKPRTRPASRNTE